METLFLFLAATAYFVFAFFRLELAVLWLSLFFPLYLLKASFAGIPFTLVELMVYGVACVYALRWIHGVLAERGRFSAFFSGVKDFFYSA